MAYISELMEILWMNSHLIYRTVLRLNRIHTLSPLYSYFFCYEKNLRNIWDCMHSDWRHNRHIYIQTWARSLPLLGVNSANPIGATCQSALMVCIIFILVGNRISQVLRGTPGIVPSILAKARSVNSSSLGRLNCLEYSGFFGVFILIIFHIFKCGKILGESLSSVLLLIYTFITFSHR